MDIISVTDVALQNVYVILQRLSEDSKNITLKCEQHLISELSSLDSNFRTEIQNYIEIIKNLNKKLKYCIDENMLAISDRINKVHDYENQTYKKRNFV